MHRIKWLLVLALLLLLIFIGVEFFAFNADLVTFNYMLGHVELPLAAVMVFSFAVGMLTAALLSLYVILPIKWRMKRLQKQVRLQQRELHTLDGKLQKEKAGQFLSRDD